MVLLTDKLFLNSASNVGIGVVSPTSPQRTNFKVLDINSGVWGDDTHSQEIVVVTLVTDILEMVD